MAGWCDRTLLSSGCAALDCTRHVRGSCRICAWAGSRRCTVLLCGCHSARRKALARMLHADDIAGSHGDREAGWTHGRRPALTMREANVAAGIM